MEQNQNQNEQGQNEEKKLKNKDFVRAFRNCFFKDESIERLTQVAKLYLNFKMQRPQATRLLNKFWTEKNITHGNQFRAVSDEEIVKWLFDFVKEHKGE